MDTMGVDDVIAMFNCVATIFAEKKDELCEMDAAMGDGDLGLTMSKGYAALPQLLRDNAGEGDIGKMLAKGGMKMSSVVPSTMGTLMSSGIMGAGKALKGKTALTPADLVVFFRAFADGLAKRGKTQLGDRTILDALDAGANAAASVDPAEGFLAIAEAAVAGAQQGVEATKDMIPKYGKAAVFAAKAKGVADQGAVAGCYLDTAIRDYFKAQA
jgi:dihydroxyacetone kinase-like protein